MLHRLHAATATLAALARAALTVAALAAVAFVVPALVLAPGVAAVVGLVIYLAVLALVRPPGLRSSWQYLRSLA